MSRFLFSQKGTSVSEYGITLSAIAIVCIVAFTFGGQAFTNALNFFSNNTESKPADTKIITEAKPNTDDKPLTGKQIIMDDGTKILLENYSSNLTQSIETAGANGATEALLNHIESIAKQLASQGKITSEEYNQMMALVKQGQLIASAEKAVENAIKTSNYDQRVLSNTAVLFNGKSYTVAELTTQFGYTGPERGPAIVQPMLATFLNLQQKTLKGIQDPIVKQTVAMLSDQVASVANGYESSVIYALSDGGSLKSTTQYTTDTNSPYMLTELYRQGIVSTDPGNAEIPAINVTISNTR